MTALKTRTRVEDFGLIPPPRGGYRLVADFDVLAMTCAFPRALAPVQDVPLAGLRATQPSVRNSSFRRHSQVASPGFHGDATPLVVLHLGVRWLHDGHHRVCVAASEGRSTMPMQVMDMDDVVITGLLHTYNAAVDQVNCGHRDRLDRIYAEHGSIFPLPAASPEARTAFEASWQQSCTERADAETRLEAGLTAHLR